MICIHGTYLSYFSNDCSKISKSTKKRYYNIYMVWNYVIMIWITRVIPSRRHDWFLQITDFTNCLVKSLNLIWGLGICRFHLWVHDLHLSSKDKRIVGCVVPAMVATETSLLTQLLTHCHSPHDDVIKRANHRGSGDLRRHRPRYYITVMLCLSIDRSQENAWIFHGTVPVVDEGRVVPVPEATNEHAAASLGLLPLVVLTSICK